MAESDEISKHKRRWLRLSVKTILIFVFILSMLLGWHTWHMRGVERQRETVRWVEENGGRVQYDFDQKRPPGPRIWQVFLGIDILGPDYFAPVAGVSFNHLDNLLIGSPPVRNTQVSDFARLQVLTNLKTLDLSFTQISDVKPLQSLASLEYLILYDTPVTDVSPLAELTNLKMLDLRDTLVIDLEPLAKLKNLKLLLIRTKKVGNDEIKKLQNALPNCDIRETME